MDGLSGSASFKMALAAFKNMPLGQQAPFNPAYSRAFAFLFGSGAGQIDTFYQAQLSIAGSATTSLRVDNASLNDWNGASISMTAIKLAYVENLSTVDSMSVASGLTTVALFVSGGVGNKIILPPKSAVMLATDYSSGWAVGGTNGGIAITNGPTQTNLCNIILFGV